MPTPSNPSLALTKFDRALPLPDFKSESLRKHVFTPAIGGSTSQVPYLSDYTNAFNHWIDSLRKLPNSVIIADFEVEDRMVVGIGQPNVLLNSITLHRVWGTPYIPGSAIKGVLNHYLYNRTQETDSNGNPIVSMDLWKEIFGTTEMAGCADFLDAWWVPNTPAQKNPLELDVVNVHHQAYYGSDGSKLATDFDDPIPSFFITSRGRYAVAVHAANEEWGEYLIDALSLAFQSLGVGAKTNANYGFLKFIEWREGEDDAQSPATNEASATAAIIGTATNETPEQPNPGDRQAVQQFLKDWGNLSDETRLEQGKAFWEQVKTAPRAFLELTGIVLDGYDPSQKIRDQNKAAKPYMNDFLTWMRANGWEDGAT